MMNKDELIIDIWERSFDWHPLETALIILSVVNGREKKEFAEMSFGKRNLLLTECYELLFGNKLNCVAECEKCGFGLEFSLSASDIKFHSEEEKNVYEFESGDYKIKYRLADSFDLAEAAGGTDIQSASNILINRCITQLTYRGENISSEKLPNNIIADFAAEASENDPCSEIQVNLVCGNCGNEWISYFDIFSFLMKSINTAAKVILNEVHVLATAYGWTESEILHLSRHKRNYYINTISNSPGF